MITLKNLTKIYQSNNEHQVKALCEVSLSLPTKGLIFVVGKSGSGKSTLLHVLGGLDSYDSGEMFVNHKSTTTFSNKDFDHYRNTSIGFIFQEYNLIESLTVKENILMASNLQNNKISNDQLVSLLNQVDLDDITNRMPNKLSGGQRQRIAIARALIKNPQIILADEPTGSIDHETGIQILDLLKLLSKDKLIIVVSHDMEYAQKYADRIIELKDGHIISDSSPYHDNKKPLNSQTEIKSHFSIKNALPFAFKDFLAKPLRIFIMIFILTVSFVLFGLSHTISQYRIEHAALQSMNLADIDYGSLNQIYTVDVLGSTYQMYPYISSEKITQLQLVYANQNLFPVYSGFDQSYRNYLYESYTSNYSFEEFTGAIELSDELIDSFELNLIAGSFPTMTNNPLEIAISKRIYEVFKTNGFNSDGVKINITSPIDMVNKSISINGKNYKISGIIDTNYDDSRYQSIYDYSDNSVSYDILKNELKCLDLYSIHNLIFLPSGYQDDLINHPSRVSTYDGSIDFRLYLEKSELNGHYYTTNQLSILKTIPTDIIWKDGVEKTSLSDNEIIIPINMIPNNLQINDLTPFQDALYQHVTDSIETFAIQHFDEIKDSFDANFPGTNTYQDYIYYINNAVENVFHEGYTYNYFLHQSTQEIISKDYFTAFESIILQGIQMVYSKTYNVEVVGFYNVTDFRNTSSQDVIILSNILYSTISNDLFLYDVSRIMVKMDNNHQDNSSFITHVLNDSSNPSWIFTNEVIGTLDYIDDLLDQVSIFTLYIGLLFAVFSSLLLYGYISIVIGNREKDIGILRALGARKLDVMKIFVLESLFIGFSAFIFASIFGLLINFWINHLLINQYNLILTILDFGMKQIILIFIISMVVSMISSVFPLYRLSLRKPIDVIKGI
ncbi:MAG: ATP-binding cassette domain-containing protein [Tenericutes bacterium]|nr:ATP-binding cassette domain-containing protein [Mycoplasmatota bacterium]